MRRGVNSDEARRGARRRSGSAGRPWPWRKVAPAPVVRLVRLLMLLMLPLPGWGPGRVGLAVTEARAATGLDGRVTLLVLGDSLTAGYGVEPGEAYPAVLQEKAKAAGLPVEVVNAGVSGDTTAGGLRRLNWLLRRPVDVLLIALGGNDGLRGLSPEATRSNLVAIIEGARKKAPGIRVILAGMQMPPNLGEDYVARYREIFPSVAREHGTGLVPHLLEGVGGRPEMNQADLIHPTSAGQAVIADNVWTVVRPVLESVSKTK